MWEWKRRLLQDGTPDPTDNPPDRLTLKIIANANAFSSSAFSYVEKYHRDTLKLVVERTNQLALEAEQDNQQREAQERQRVQDHEAKVREAANRLKFD